MQTPKASAIESQIDGFLAKYAPAIEGELRDARARLRNRFPSGFELVYDSYNALVFSFSPSERTSDAFISVTGYPKWITLFFLHGARLRDPNGLLEGEGKQVRAIRLQRAADIDSAPVQALIAQARDRFRAEFLDAAPLTTVVKLVSAKQRPRRPAASRPAQAAE